MTYTGPLPGQAEYGQYAAQAQEAYQRALARIQGQRSDILNQAGLQGQYDQNGKYTGFSVASGQGSELGAYQQMMRGLGQNADSLDAGLSGNGFMGGGLNQQAQETNQMGDASQVAGFGRQLLGGMGQLDQQGQQATEDYNTGLSNEMQMLIEQSISGGNFNQGDFSGLPTGGYGNPDDPFVPPRNAGGGGGGWRPPKPRRRR